MKIFLATAFSSKVDETGKVLLEFRKPVEQLLELLRKNNQVFCAAEYEGWQYFNAAPEVGAKLDLEEVAKADVLLALLTEKVSAGVQIEIGYALGQGKQVIIATMPGVKLSYFTQGVANLGLAKHVVYQDSADLAKQFQTKHDL